MPKADLAGAGDRREGPATQPSRRGTRPITIHFPAEVRNQLKILAIEQDTTMHRLVAEAFNDLFAKYGKPRIAPEGEPES